MDPPADADAAPPEAAPGAPGPDAERGPLLRRRQLAGVAADAPTVGLALSGGGLRSATFGLGLLRGLAQSGLLPRLDYLSTVSGGGYVGAMFGRLVGQLGIARAQALLALGRSPLLDWLRRNGRYLTPAGARDIGIAAATYLRAILAIHGESLLASLPGIVLVMLPHLGLLAGDDIDLAGWASWGTLWWPIALAFALALAPGLMAAFWVARDAPEPGRRPAAPPLRDGLFALLLFAALVPASLLAARGFVPRGLARGDTDALLFAGGLLALWSGWAGLVYTPLRLRFGGEPHALAAARLRNGLTQALRRVLLASLSLAVLGLLDVVSWWALTALLTSDVTLLGGVGASGLVVLAMRTLAPPLQQIVNQADAGALRRWGPKLLNAAGLLGLLLLGCTWLMGAQWLVFSPTPLAALGDLSPGVRASALLLLGLLWWLLSARNEQMANASSLHGFYRARLTRAYLAVGNPSRRLVGADGGAQGTAAGNVTQVLAHDDLALADYTPEAAGGPLHLINLCLNQTRDDASGLYNADRKGTIVTVSARGYDIGPQAGAPAAAPRAGSAAPAGTLGRWIAASGAAAAPGAGSNTSPGWALVMFFLGVRLGYWARSPETPPGGWRGALAWRWRAAVKPLMLASEATATYYGRARPWWYLSDGGHFENTGVYALLKRRVDFIVLADASADADYAFRDIENLVRKARIDLGAEIEFYPREEAMRLITRPSPELTVLSPEDMADNHSARGVMLARVRYPADANGRRQESTLLVVKPNLHDALDLDLLAYAQRHPRFPHQSAAEQSFDEAQWESYHRLGEDFGRALCTDWLTQLPGWSERRSHPLRVSARLHGGAAVAPAAPASEPLWRRTARATAIGTTLGLGATGTLLLSLWQFSDGIKQREASAQTEARKLFDDVSKALAGFDGSCPKVAEHVGVDLLLLRDLSLGDRLRPVEREGVNQLLERVRSGCELPSQPSAECLAAVQQAQAGLCAQVEKPPAVDHALSYWHPVPARITLTALWHGVGGGAATAVAVAPAPPPAPPPAPAPEPAAAAPQPPPPSTPPPEPQPAQVKAEALAAACGADGPVRLYTQIYDEASRPGALNLGRLLQARAGPALRVAPIENVTRSAELRQQRRPVPWPRPTLLVHDGADLGCARAIAAVVRGSLPGPAVPDDAVWVRSLPRSLTPSRGVLELWLPPAPAAAGSTGQ